MAMGIESGFVDEEAFSEQDFKDMVGGSLEPSLSQVQAGCKLWVVTN